jgi:hypothetical protein
VSVVLLALALVLLALPRALAGPGARLAPQEWCRAVVLCVRVGMLAFFVALCAAALPVVLGAVGAHGLAHACSAFVTGAALPAGVGAGAGLAAVASRSSYYNLS